MTNQTHAPAGSRRQSTEQAIQLAIQGRWDEAEQLNRQLLAAFPDDTDAHNRLGKALTELGRYSEARASYTRTLEIDPTNSIARKNLTRLATLDKATVAPAAPGGKVDPHLFVEETGKTGVLALQRPASETLLPMTAGDRVALRRQERSLVAENARGDYLGAIEPRVALRLIKLMDGGNEYAAAIASISEHSARIIIKEIYQHPSLTGKLSFPPVGPEGFRPYTKESLIRYDLDDEEAAEEEGEPSDEWEGEAEPAEGDVPLYDHLRRTEPDEKDDEYEE
jgi:hypothetical protein